MKAFKVDLDNSKNQSILKLIARYPNNQAHQVNEVAEKIHELIKNAPYSNDNIVLKRNEIKEAFFSPFKPQLKNAQVFLSHSHADRNKALEVKNYLESQTDHRVFIDSPFWDYKNNILKEMKKHHINVSKIEDAFTLILRESLQDMIEMPLFRIFTKQQQRFQSRAIVHHLFSMGL